jgi:hypothetical protein
MSPPAAKEGLSVTVAHQMLDRHLRDYLEGLPPETGAHHLSDTVRSILQKPFFSFNYALPVWLGKRFGMRGPDLQALLLANTFHGLYYGLMDGLMDGHTGNEANGSPFQVPHLGVICTLFYGEGMLHYAQIGNRFPAFWRERGGFECEWGAAIGRERSAKACSPGPIDLRHAAAKGAPIKNTVAFVRYACDLSASDCERLLLMLDQTMAAMILLDDIADWETDITEGRANQFARLLSHAAGAPEVSLTAVKRALLTTNAAERYIADVITLLHETKAALSGVALSDWANFLDLLLNRATGETEKQQTALAAYLRLILAPSREEEEPNAQ